MNVFTTILHLSVCEGDREFSIWPKFTVVYVKCASKEAAFRRALAIIESFRIWLTIERVGYIKNARNSYDVLVVALIFLNDEAAKTFIFK